MFFAFVGSGVGRSYHAHKQCFISFRAPIPVLSCAKLLQYSDMTKQKVLKQCILVKNICKTTVRFVNFLNIARIPQVKKEMAADIIRDSLRQAQQPSLTCSGMVADSVSVLF